MGNFLRRADSVGPTGRASDWLVIGVSGVTCGGKTTLANRLQETLVPVYVFHQDKYFYQDDSPNHVRCVGLEHNNYDILSALDMEGMYRDIVDTIRGVDMSQARNVERVPGKYELRNKNFLIVEGFTALNYKPILELCDLRYYFVLTFEECVARRCFRLYEPPDVDGYFEQCVWPEHLRYRAEVEKDNRVTILDGTRSDALEVVLDELRTRGALPLA